MRETLNKLARYDTPTICNVIELFEVRSRAVGYMDGTIRAACEGLPPMVGFAATATVQASQPGAGTDIYKSIELQMQKILELPGPAVVVFQDLDDPAVGASFGEVMCGSYKAFGCVGLISSGAGRDIEQVRQMQFPVFIGSTICSHAYTQLVEIGVEVDVGGITVSNGELLHGDTNGVTTVPLDIASEVADVADEYIAAERIVLDYLEESGETEVQKLVECRRAMGQTIGELRNRVSRKHS